MSKPGKAKHATKVELNAALKHTCEAEYYAAIIQHMPIPAGTIARKTLDRLVTELDGLRGRLHNVVDLIGQIKEAA
jgi:hypothetical protein